MVTIFFLHLACVAVFVILAFRAPVREDFHDSACDWRVPSPAPRQPKAARGVGFLGSSKTFPG